MGIYHNGPNQILPLELMLVISIASLLGKFKVSGGAPDQDIFTVGAVSYIEKYCVRFV